MSVILCRKEQVTHPYYIEHLGKFIYTSQELCYAMYHHPILVMDGFIDENLLEFIREELGMGFAALKMDRWMKSGENQDELIFLFLQECNYYNTLEINRLRKTVSALRKLPPLEYAKQKADYLFGFKQYGRAMDGYEKILESFLTQKAENRFVGRVWNNLGACYARVFQFDKALDAYDKAYAKLKDPTILEKIYHLNYLKNGDAQENPLPLGTAQEVKAVWDEHYEQAVEAADESEELKRLDEMFVKDPVKRMEGARLMLETWKQEYRSMA